MIVFQFTNEVLKNAERAAKTDNIITYILVALAGFCVGMLVLSIIEYIKDHEL